VARSAPVELFAFNGSKEFDNVRHDSLLGFFFEQYDSQHPEPSKFQRD